MSDQIKHECGIALVRLLKPLEFYQYKYGSWRYGLEKMYLLMEKQHNRGQDGAGMVSLKIDCPSGNKYLHRHRSADSNPINQIFKKIYSHFSLAESTNPGYWKDIAWIKNYLPFASNLYLGHLRYGTYGKNNKSNVHPVTRENNWRSRNLALVGNFNLTNMVEIFQKLVDLGQHPKEFSDTITMLENIGHFLDVENQRLFDKYKNQNLDNKEISDRIQDEIDVANIFRESSKKWDGGYVIAGLIGHGDAFVCRDPWGIRPAYYYQDDEIAVATSERPPIQTAFNVPIEKVKELPPGNCLVIKKSGRISIENVRDNKEKKACSFERIYFSRGSDFEIYKERKKLGELLTPTILKVVDYDLENTVFSFIPNTAETAYYGLIHGLEDYYARQKVKLIKEKNGNLTDEELERIIALKPRIEKAALKDIKLRTFIAQDKGREDLVAHVYDISYGTIKKGVDNLVVIDDSIVRGTTLKQSILRILDRLGPKKIIVASSAPQIRYPDCYGIDMAKLGDFIAFKAAIELLKENGKESIINKVYKDCIKQKDLPKENVTNCVKRIYEPFTAEQISIKISELLTQGNNFNAEVRIVYQSIEDLHKACPNNKGDWYFTGNYPTPGGNKVSNKAFINFVEGKDERAY
jgi:amidophosphoribosyltransferase